MMRIIVPVLIGLAFLAFAIVTPWGRRIVSELRSILSWVWLARASMLGLLIMLALPVLARGGGGSGARSLLIGVYDLHADDMPGLRGVASVGMLLAFGAWTVFVTTALTLSYGHLRSDFPERAPRWLLLAVRALVMVALVLNAWTAIVATDEGDRGIVAAVLAGGLFAGLCAVWIIEEVHRRMNEFPMRIYHLLPHAPIELVVKPGGAQRGLLQDMRLSERLRHAFRGYVKSEGERSYLLPGHGLAVLATLFFALGMYVPLSYLIEPEGQLTALTYLLVSLITWIWILSGVTFFFDAYRIPVFAPLILWLIVARLSPQSDHFYRIWPAEQTLAEARAAGEAARAPLSEMEAPPLTPGEVLARAQSSKRRIVLVAAAGGGIQSAAWTAKVLAGLESCVATREPGRFARSVQMMSGVSGGSTGIMFFAQAYGRSGFAGPRTSEDSRTYDKKLLENIVAAAAATSLGQSTWGYAYPDLGRAYFPFTIQNPFRDRGEAMEKAWAFNARKLMGNAGENLGISSLREWQADARAGLRPATIFNGTIVETGDRMCFSTAPPAKGVEGRCEFWAPTRRHPEDPHCANFLYPGADIRITTAVRLSATFPFVSPTARPGVARHRDGTELLDPMDRDARGLVPGATGKLHVADGGYYENSALSDLSQWLDRGLTVLAEKPETLPTEVLVIQIEAFPEGEMRPDHHEAKPPEPQGNGERGAIFQVIAPIATLNSVRNSGHTAFANYDFALLQHRWRIHPASVTIRHVRFVLPRLQPAPKPHAETGWMWPAWAEATTDEPPLSWHLRKPEQLAIDAAWERLMSERKADPAGMPLALDELEWVTTKIRPIDKVLQFLATEAPPRVVPPAATPANETVANQ